MCKKKGANVAPFPFSGLHLTLLKIKRISETQTRNPKAAASSTPFVASRIPSMMALCCSRGTGPIQWA